MSATATADQSVSSPSAATAGQRAAAAVPQNAAFNSAGATQGEAAAGGEGEDQQYFAHVLCTYSAQNDQCLSVSEGDDIQILESYDEWLLARDIMGLSGYVPASHVRVY